MPQSHDAAGHSAGRISLNSQLVAVRGLSETGDAAASRPALLLLHGAGMDASVWESQRHGLSRDWRVLAPDLPAHGGSKGPALTSIPDMADWVLALAKALDLRHFALAGHSMGALIALDLAGRRPEVISRLALLGCAAEMPVNPALLEAARETPEKAAAMIAKWGFGRKADPAGPVAACRDLLLRAPSGVLHADLVACAAYDRGAEAAAEVTVPSLVIAGAEDRMTPVEAGRALAERLPQGRVVVLPEVGHMMMLEAAQETLDALASL